MALFNAAEFCRKIFELCSHIGSEKADEVELSAVRSALKQRLYCM